LLGVIGIGDNVCDLYIGSGLMYPGGQALNVAVYAKQMGARAAYLGVFGNDVLAAHVIATLDTLKIDHSHCRQYEGENGYAIVDLVDGERIFVRSNRGGVVNKHPIQLTPADLDYIRSFDVIHSSNNGHFDTQLGLVASIGPAISYDFSRSWRDSKHSREICPYLDFAFISCGDSSDEEALNACRRLRNEGCGIVVATMGGKGALFHDGQYSIKQEPCPVKAVDTLGAGDSFAAGFLVSFMTAIRLKNGAMKDQEYYLRNIQAALKNGAAAAAKACMGAGAFGYSKHFDTDRLGS
jgi:fructoselysine 6-kinase